ncbi:uncharacterized protein LOC132191567 [Corylus avellana]|uniref:uncharacterized protein LOC132191567 n=1 Tax=Corylus avellana TaxID=13451 RepID=UPI00286D17BE|nr:uncharacterized protein LOC132191567 [Corylus avellana]
MAVNHFSHKHPLIFAEELKNEKDKKEVVCSGCEEPISGPGYKCSECNFFLNKSCIELPREIQHRLHPNHTLILKAPEKKNYCDACRKNCTGCFFYRCDGCDFDLDIKCASRWKITTNDCHQHAFIPILENIQFTCKVCGEEGKDIAYLCTICQLLIHHKCALFQRTIHISAHDHLLTLTYSLHDQDTGSSKVFCRLCYKKVNTKYAIYYCQKCSYIVHLNCPSFLGHRIHNKRGLTITRRNKTHQLADLVKAVQDETAQSQKMIKHFSHDQHNLILSEEKKLEDDKLCEGCMQLISVPFYSCLSCNFFLHERCAKLATKIERHPLHEHPLTLLPYEDVFYCDACNHLRHGFVYICNECPNYSLDIQCFSIPEIFNHEGHQHLLYLAISSEEKCYACDSEYRSPCVFVCTECEFALGFECATLPLVARHEYDTHLLKLTSTAEDCFKEYYCLICEGKREPNHWFYYCTVCDFPAHPECVLGKYPYIKFGRALLNTDHKHPIAFVRKTEHSPPCDACRKHFNGIAVECTECKFIGHMTCYARDRVEETSTSTRRNIRDFLPPHRPNVYARFGKHVI